MSQEGYVSQDLMISRRYLPHWQAGGSTYFIGYDLVDRGATIGGPLTMEERRLAKEAILFWHRKKWDVHVLTIMPDHVHVLARPLEVSPQLWYPLSEILYSVKRFSSGQINKMRRRRGTLWQHEGYDRIVRNEREFEQRADYIINNAVMRGLVVDPYAYDGLWGEWVEFFETKRPCLGQEEGE